MLLLTTAFFFSASAAASRARASSSSCNLCSSPSVTSSVSAVVSRVLSPTTRLISLATSSSFGSPAPHGFSVRGEGMTSSPDDDNIEEDALLSCDISDFPRGGG